MNPCKAIVVLAMITGCAGASTPPARDVAVGHWSGKIDGAGWSQPLALQIENDAGRYHGIWASGRSLVAQPLESVDVRGDGVRLETERLVFLGRVQGTRLSGIVFDKRADAPPAEFSVTTDPARFEPGSEPSFSGME
jgi:hypothetical protein